jgi:DNA-binding response OmpR family regulator
MEFILLRLLVEHAGSVVSRDRMMKSLYGNSIHTTDRAIDAHIARLRKKLGGHENPDELIRTVHGAGYTLAAAVHCE